MEKSVYCKLIELLDSRNFSYRTVSHEETFTSEESAKARGEDVSIGGKALVLKVGEQFHLFVISASLKVDSSAIRKYFGSKKMRFATKEELFELTGLVPGAVPPFGEPLLPFELYVDNSICANEKIAFNAGSLCESVIMLVKDYLSSANPTVFSFSKVEAGS